VSFPPTVSLRNALGAATIAALILPAVTCADEREVDFVQFEGLLREYCLDWHNASEQEGDVDFQTGFSRHKMMSQPVLLDNMEWAIAEEEMPPLTADKQPTREERAMMLAWVEQAIYELRNSRPNDPGRVVMPRLNHHQYQRVVDDLSGANIDTSSVFPMSGAGASGFPNDGESMTATPMEVEKFITSAKYVLSYARITPTAGLNWADRASVTLTMNDQAMRDDIVLAWGNKMQGEYMKAFNRTDEDRVPELIEAAWILEHKDKFSRPDITAAEIGERYDPPLPGPIIENWRELLTTDKDVGDYLGRLAEAWRRMTPGSGATYHQVRDYAERMAELFEFLKLEGWSVRWQRDHDLEVTHPRIVRKAGKQIYGDDNFHRTIENQTTDGQIHVFAEPRHESIPDQNQGAFWILISPAGDGAQNDVVLIDEAYAGTEDKMVPVEGSPFSIVKGQGRMEDGALMVQAPAIVRFEAPENAKLAMARIRLHPNRGQEGSIQVKVAPVGQAPDDLDRLPGRLVVTAKDSESGMRMRRSSEFVRNALGDRQWNIGKWKAPPKPSGEVPEKLWPATMANNLPTPVEAPRMLGPKEVISMMSPEEQRTMEKLAIRLADTYRDFPDSELQRRGREIIGQFARRAWRGNVHPADTQPLYRMLDQRLANGESFDSAVKMPLVAIMAHPNFMFQIQQTERAEQSYALSDHELASRLSFALWGSIPDEELLALADRGELSEPATLQAQAVRMLNDDKGKRLAEDFAGYWLGYQGFDEYAGVDKEKFEEFDKELRRAMYDEVVHFSDALFRQGRPVTDALDADYTFVNETLAQHYGIDGVKGGHMREVQLPADSPRGGVATMAAVLTKTSKPLRTSQVLRGAWILEEVLGEHIPAPPDNVPLLSDDPVDDKGRTLLEQLKAHRDNDACRSCHARMDPIGVAMENFDPIGRWRAELQPGVELITAAPLPEGQMLDGVPGLKAFLKSNQEKFVEHLCHRFLAYMLGRRVLPTDGPLLEEMHAALAHNQYRFDEMLKVVVGSEQFRMRRDELREDLAMNESFQPAWMRE